MTNKEKWQRAFSALHTSKEFETRMENKVMAKRKLRFRPALTALCAALALVLGGTSVYAADVGGVQRQIQLWLHGELTDVTFTYSDDTGSYSLADPDGNIVQMGGGVEMHPDGSVRTLGPDELAAYLENAVNTDVIEGKLCLLYKDQVYDLSATFGESDFHYVTLVDGDKKIYVTVHKDGTCISSDHKYPLPGDFILPEISR